MTKKRKTFKIFLGRGNGVANKAGNQLYRQTIRDTQRVYQEAKTHKEKEQIAVKLIEDLEQMGATFHFQVDKRWMKAPNDVVLKRVKQALREKHQAKADKVSNHDVNTLFDGDCIEDGEEQQMADEQHGLPRNKIELLCEDGQSSNNIEKSIKDGYKWVHSSQLASLDDKERDNSAVDAPSDDVLYNYEDDRAGFGKKRSAGNVFTKEASALLLNGQDNISSLPINRVRRHTTSTTNEDAVTTNHDIAAAGISDNKRNKREEQQEDHYNSMSKKSRRFVEAALPDNSAPCAFKSSTIDDDVFEPIKLGEEELVGDRQEDSSSIELMKLALLNSVEPSFITTSEVNEHNDSKNNITTLKFGTPTSCSEERRNSSMSSSRHQTMMLNTIVNSPLPAEGGRNGEEFFKNFSIPVKNWVTTTHDNNSSSSSFFTQHSSSDPTNQQLPDRLRGENQNQQEILFLSTNQYDVCENKVKESSSSNENAANFIVQHDAGLVMQNKSSENFFYPSSSYNASTFSNGASSLSSKNTNEINNSNNNYNDYNYNSSSHAKKMKRRKKNDNFITTTNNKLDSLLGLLDFTPSDASIVDSSHFHEEMNHQRRMFSPSNHRMLHHPPLTSFMIDHDNNNDNAFQNNIYDHDDKKNHSTAASNSTPNYNYVHMVGPPLLFHPPRQQNEESARKEDEEQEQEPAKES